MDKNNRSPYLFLDPGKMTAEFAGKRPGVQPLEGGIPLVELSDPVIQRIYYFRWHTYFSHIKPTPRGWVVTEFSVPVGWSGKYETISCPAGHHFYEGRWIHDPSYLEEYARFWFTEEASPRLYSFWAADAISAFCKVRGDLPFFGSLLDGIKNNYAGWEREKLTESGLFTQIDDRDGMEFSIGGSGCRPTINSYMCGDAAAIAEACGLLGLREDEKLYRGKAEKLKELINTLLWDPEARFFKTRGEGPDGRLADVREEVGYVPWYFSVPDGDKSDAWKFLNDEKYFKAPFGPTTAERCHPRFMEGHRHSCLWNGPSWPFATSQTLTALGNLICGYDQDVMDESDYFDLLRTYAGSHFLTDETGAKVPFIDENLDPFTGRWIAKEWLESRDPQDPSAGRGFDYNHSTFCDLVLNGLAGIRPSYGDELVIHPLFGRDDLDYFCADGVLYHGSYITVLWDRTGEKYGRGAGLTVFRDGEAVAKSETLREIRI